MKKLLLFTLLLGAGSFLNGAARLRYPHEALEEAFNATEQWKKNKPLFDAVLKGDNGDFGDFEATFAALESGIPVDSRDFYNRTALHFAASRGSEAIVKLLVAKHADVNACTFEEGRTPLLDVVIGSNLSYSEDSDDRYSAVARALLKKGAKITKEIKARAVDVKRHKKLFDILNSAVGAPTNDTDMDTDSKPAEE